MRLFMIDSAIFYFMHIQCHPQCHNAAKAATCKAANVANVGNTASATWVDKLILHYCGTLVVLLYKLTNN